MMKVPFRLRNRLPRRRETATEDVSFTLQQLYRPRRDDLRFGLFLFGEALYQAPLEDAPKPADSEDELPPDSSPGRKPAEEPAEDPHEAAAYPTVEESQASQDAPKDTPAEQTATADEYAAADSFEAVEISTGDALGTNDLPKAAIVYEETAAAVDEPVVEEPAVDEPIVDEPTVEEPTVEEPAVEEVADDVATAPATPAEAAVDPGSTPVDNTLPPGIYICIDQDIDGTTDANLSIDVEGDFSQLATGTSSAGLTTYQIDYLAEAEIPAEASGDDAVVTVEELPESLWWAGWQQVSVTVQVLEWESWSQDVDVDVDQHGEDGNVFVLVEQDTWIRQKAVIAISANGDGTVLNITTQAVIYTEIEQYTKVTVTVGSVGGLDEGEYEDEAGDEADLAAADGADADTDTSGGSTPLVDVEIQQTVSVDQDVFVMVDVEDGLELSLDVLLGQISAVLHDVDVTVNIVGDELTLVICADQYADIDQTLSVSLEVDDVAGAIVPDAEDVEDDEDDEDDALDVEEEEEEEEEGEREDTTASVSDNQSTVQQESATAPDATESATPHDETRVEEVEDATSPVEDDSATEDAEDADDEAALEELQALLDAAFASGEDLAFDSFFDAWATDSETAASDDEEPAPKTTVTVTADDLPEESADADADIDGEDDQHL